jgi:acetyl esterase/lipase
MKRIMLSLLLFSTQSLVAQEIKPLWSEPAPYAKPNSLKEVVKEALGVPCAYNVTTATLTIHAAQGKPSGHAMIILPGGGYELESIVAEGRLIAEYLSSRGIVAAVLKYRLPLSQSCTQPHLVPITDARKAISVVNSKSIVMHHWKGPS